MMAINQLFIIPYVFIPLVLCSIVNCESFVNDFEDKLGVAYEFKVHVDAGREDCFYQNVEQGASLYVAFQVC